MHRMITLITTYLLMMLRPEQNLHAFLPAGIQTSRNFLVVVAHPDNECLFFSLTIVILTSRGKTGHLVVFSTGNSHGLDPVRAKELSGTCQRLGIDLLITFDRGGVSGHVNHKSVAIWASNISSSTPSELRRLIDCLGVVRVFVDTRSTLHAGQILSTSVPQFLLDDLSFPDRATEQTPCSVRQLAIWVSPRTPSLSRTSISTALVSTFLHDVQTTHVHQ
jgi:hypothetical protein